MRERPELDPDRHLSKRRGPVEAWRKMLLRTGVGDGDGRLGLVAQDRLLGLARYERVVSSGCDVAVGRAPPPQVLAALLDAMLANVRGEPGAVNSDVDREDVTGGGVVEGHRFGVTRDVTGFPQERAVDDGELETLTAVDRQHLHCLGI